MLKISPTDFGGKKKMEVVGIEMTICEHRHVSFFSLCGDD